MSNFKTLSTSHFTPFILLAGDLLVLLGFVLAGQIEHELVDPVSPVLRLLTITAAFAGVWLIAGWRLGIFPREIAPSSEVAPGGGIAPTRRSYGILAFLEKTLIAWLVTAPLGVLIRGFVLGRAVIPTIFLVVTLGLGAALLLTWRLIFALIWTRRAR